MAKEWGICDLENDDSSLDKLIYVGMTGKYKRVNEDEVDLILVPLREI